MGKVLSKREEGLGGHYGYAEKRRARHKTGVSIRKQSNMVQKQVEDLVAHSVNNVEWNHVIGNSHFFPGPYYIYSFFSKIT